MTTLIGPSGSLGGIPAAVASLEDAIAAADGLLVVSRAANAFNANGEITDSMAREIVPEYLDGFAGKVRA